MGIRYQHQCIRCEHSWRSYNDTPERCPGCLTRRWTAERRLVTCRRCSYQWEPRRDAPHTCPVCRTPNWNAPGRISRVGTVIARAQRDKVLQDRKRARVSK